MLHWRHCLNQLAAMTISFNVPELSELEGKTDEELISIFGLDKPLKGIKETLTKLNALPADKKEKAAELFKDTFQPDVSEWQLDDILYDVKDKERSAVEVMNDEDFE